MSHSASKKLLLLSWTIPPTISGSSYITHQLLNALPNDLILPVGGGKPFLQYPDHYQNIRYRYLPTEWSIDGMGARFFSPIRWLSFPFVLFRLWMICRKQAVDKVLAVFPDGYFLLLGLIISSRLRVPFYTYFHNTYVDNRKGINKWFAKKIQALAFQKSVRIFTMSEGMDAYYKQQYPDLENKFVVLPHSHSTKTQSKKRPPLSAIHFPLRCVLIGTINQSNLDATRRVLSLVANHPEEFNLDIYSPSNQQLLQLKYKLPLDQPGINHCGSIAQEEIDHVLPQYDVCVLTHGFTGDYTPVEYQTIFPTRSVPLFASGVPILVHSPPNSFLTDFIRKYDCGELVSIPSEDQLLRALRHLRDDHSRRLQLQINQMTASNYFHSDRIASILKMHIQLEH